MELEGPDGQRYFVALHDDVYRPSDDTLLLARAVHAEVRLGDHVLEVGCGAGYIALVAARAGAAVTATDTNPHAVALARHNARENGLAARVEVVEADLLAGLRGPFDVVAFNPPYLPTAPDDYVPGPLNLAFDGGPDGNAVALRFAAQVAALRPPPRCVLVVHSSLSDPAPLQRMLERSGFANDVAAEEAHAFERLTVQRFRPAAG